MSDFLIEHFKQIIPLDEKEAAYIASHFTYKKFKKHQFVVQEGSPVPYSFLVAKGSLKSYHTDDNGKEHILQFGFENWWITDFHAYSNETPATIHVDCMEDSELYCLSLQDREKLCLEMHKVAYFFLTKANKGYLALQQRILSLLNSNAKERYEQLLLLYPGILNKVPKQLIAAYLGVSRETLSRL
ncbi:Crp/Fnr family transcriptional regulator [Chitinophaga niabensis]|uniref:Crp/Fnr family transcriptional regulator n=1 Tax=Chitinophaga niabensis TaxID=536979 RepID=UPI0031BAC5FC